MALTMAVTVSPGRRAMCSADRRVMTDTISRPPTLTATSAMTFPSVTDFTVQAKFPRTLDLDQGSGGFIPRPASARNPAAAMISMFFIQRLFRRAPSH